MYTDAHLHLYDLARSCNFECTAVYNLMQNLREYLFCTNSTKLSELEYTEHLCQKENLKAIFSFGIHPQNPDISELDTLEKLLNEKRISVIGEIGFDLFDDKNRNTFIDQETVWNAQLELALQYNVPILLHLRKANHLLFKSLKPLKKIKAVIFHGWAGSIIEAKSLLNANINAFFSLGKSILRGKKTVIEMAKTFPLEYLLTETDAPYMQLKNETLTVPSDIKNVVCKISEVRFGSSEKNLTVLISQLHENFLQAFF